MNTITKLSALSISILLCISAFAQKPTRSYSKSVLNGPNWTFRENKGQLMDENRKPLSEIPFYGKQGGVNIYCKPGMISFTFIKSEKDDKVSEATGQAPLNLPKGETLAALNHRTVGSGHTLSPSGRDGEGLTITRADLILLNSNIDAEIAASDRQAYYENYYTTGDADHGIANVHTYKTITYKSIYPNIDIVLEAKEKGMEYSFVVYPGGNVADIQLKWNGLDNIKELENGGIEYSLPNPIASLRESPYLPSVTATAADFTRNPLLNNSNPTVFTQSAPVCYQQTPINSKLIIHNSTLSFSVPIYDKTKILVIDPTLGWGTYYGGLEDDAANGVVTDKNNNIYITGSTASNSGIATKGSIISNYVGSDDIFVAKFDSSGSLVWGTYYGGIGRDDASAIAIDMNNNLYITGYTFSTSGFATYNASFKKGDANNGNAFIVKITSSGGLSWATYYGGDSVDVENGISTDTHGNVYITGYTESSKGIASSGAHQTSYAGGYNYGDAFIAKFNTSGSFLWGTYYGSTGDDQSMGITSDADSNIYITGYTGSTSGIATTGAYRTSNDSGDVFVAKFTSSGALSWGTYYGGDKYDEGDGITWDTANNLYITGYTKSKNGIATSGTHQTSMAGYYNVFIAKFTSAGSFRWGTYYGGGGADRGYSVTTDVYDNAYVTGYATSVSGIATSGAYQTSFAGISPHYWDDAFIAKFNKSGALSWGTYYGGTGDDNGYSICINGLNDIFVSGATGSSSSIATSGTHSNYFAGGFYDAFLVKFHFTFKDDAGIVSILTPKDTILQTKLPVKITLHNFGSDSLKSANINWSLNNSLQKTYKWTGNLYPDSSVEVIIDTFNFSKIAFDTLKAWTSLPNGKTDSTRLNDSATNIIDISGDTARPVITLLGGDTVYLDEGGKYAEPGYKAFDLHDGDITSKVVVKWIGKPVQILVPGTYYRAYNVKDSAGNPAIQKIRLIIVHNDTLPPNLVVGCQGNPDTLYVAQGSSFIDPGICSANDLVCGDMSGSVKSSGSVNTSIIGEDSITYTVCDYTNNCISKKRYVFVVPNANTGVSQVINPAGKMCGGKQPVIVIIKNYAPDVLSSVNVTWSLNNSIENTFKWSGSLDYESTDTVVIDSFDFTVSGSMVIKAWTSLPNSSTDGVPANDSFSTTVNFLLTPTDNAGKDTSVCFGNKTTIGRNAVSGDSYKWTSNPIGFTSTSSNPSVSPAITTTYNLSESITTTGCSATNSVIVKVNPLPDAHWVASLSNNKVSFIPNNNSAKSYVWHFGNGDSSAAENPVYTYQNKGNYKVDLLAESNAGCIAMYDSNIVISTFTGLQNAGNQNANLLISPNPFTTILYISYSLPQSQNVQLTLTDMTGKKVAALINENQNPGQHVYNLDAAKYNIPAGIYFLQMISGNDAVEQKIVRIR